MQNFHTYLYGLAPVFRKNEEFYVYDRWEKKGSQYIISNYTLGKSGRYKYKKDLGENLDEEYGRDWHWHHIVVKDHLKPLFNPTDWKNMIDVSIPCVLIACEEHKYYNMMHEKGVQMAFNLPPAGHHGFTGFSRSNYIKKLRSVYKDFYESREVLLKIANNFLNGIP